MNAKIMKVLLLLVAAVFTLSLFAGTQIDTGKKNTKTEKKDQKKEEKKDPNDPEMVKKMQSIVIPNVDFQKLGLPEAVKKLNELAMLNDPAKLGVIITIDVNDQIGGTDVHITYTKDNVNLETALKAVCKLAGYNYLANPDGVKLSKPANAKKDNKL